ncbi:hypothetical protein WA171_007057 [Blastocystis sp. BT1]
MEVEDDLDRLLEIENDQLQDDAIQESQINYPEELDIIEEKPPEAVPAESVQNGPSLEELFDEEVNNILGEISDAEEPVEEKPMEKREDYLFSTPPEGQSVACKLMDGSMVFIKRRNDWKTSFNLNLRPKSLLSEPIESLIDRVREERIRKEERESHLEEEGGKRSALLNWGTKYEPTSFLNLLSDEHCNRIFLTWLTQWKPLLFQTLPNESTTEVDALPFVMYCPECHQGGYHSTRCHSKPPLRPYFRPDLPSPLPTRPANPVFFLCGPTGCGKSTLVQIAAKTMHLRVVSIGSELSGTSQDDLVHQLESLWEMDSISFSTRIPPLGYVKDNFDTSFSSIERRHIISFLVKRYEEAKADPKKRLFPVVITCSNLYDCESQRLRSYYQILNMPQITSQQQLSFLQRVCSQQQIPHTMNGLKDLVALSEGDIRFSITALQSLILSGGRITSDVVAKSTLGNKEQTKTLQEYWRLIFLCTRQHGRSGLIVSNLPDIFHHYFDINPIQVADGVMEYLPTIAVPDPTLQKYVTALEALIEYHRIREFSWKLSDFAIQRTLPTYLGIIHILYRRERPAQLKPVYPRAGSELRRMSRQYKDALKGIRFSRGMCISEGTRSLPLIVEYVSPLLHVITPTIRPVETLLLTITEKLQIQHIVEIMAEYGVSYESSQKTGMLTIGLNPDLVSIATFPEIPHPFVKVMNTVKFRIQGELQKYRIQHGMATGESISHHIERAKPETPKKAPVLLHQPKADESVEKRMTPIKRSTFFSSQHESKTRKKVKGIVFRYQQGFTCAVRQAALMSDFL